jgi:hypothetical protein
MPGLKKTIARLPASLIATLQTTLTMRPAILGSIRDLFGNLWDIILCWSTWKGVWGSYEIVPFSFGLRRPFIAWPLMALKWLDKALQGFIRPLGIYCS